jgi:bacillithiol system protein YtxJ
MNAIDQRRATNTILCSAIHALSEAPELEHALERSFNRPVFVFKHSARCGLSAHAHAEIETLLADPNMNADVFVVDAWSARSVSNALAARFSIRHESPQVLLITNNRMVWSAAHFRVTGRVIRAALASLPEAGGADSRFADVIWHD